MIYSVICVMFFLNTPIWRSMACPKLKWYRATPTCYAHRESWYRSRRSCHIKVVFVMLKKPNGWSPYPQAHGMSSFLFFRLDSTLLKKLLRCVSLLSLLLPRLTASSSFARCSSVRSLAMVIMVPLLRAISSSWSGLKCCGGNTCPGSGTTPIEAL